jgi:UDP-glucose 4-epimerase
MNVLVTGGSGLIGKFVVDFIGRTHRVSVLDIREPAAPHPFFWVDILNLPALLKAMNHDFDAVVHMAAVPHPLNDPAEKVFTVNVVGTFNVLEAASRCDVKKVVFISSESVLGFAFMSKPACPAYVPIDEAHPLSPQDPYGLSKLLGEEICRSYALKHEMQCVCLRPPWVWVPEEDELKTYRDLVRDYPKWFKNLWAYVHVEDLASAVLAALETEGLAPNEVFFITADDNWCGKDSRALLKEFYPEVHAIAESFHGQQSLITSRRAKEKLGYKPRHTWRELVDASGA